MSHSLFFFFNDTATTEIYTLSLHDALPIYGDSIEENSNIIEGNPMKTLIEGDDRATPNQTFYETVLRDFKPKTGIKDRKSTRLNSSHSQISYAVFCLNKKPLDYIEAQYLTR